MRIYLSKFKFIFSKADFNELAIIFLGMLGMGFLEILSISSIFPFMAVVTNPTLIQENTFLLFIYNFFSFSSNREFLIWSGFSVIGLLAITNAFNAFVNWKIIRFVNMQTHYVSLKLFRGYLMQPFKFFLDRNSSDLSKNILSEVSRSISGVVLPGLNTVAKLIVSIFLFSMLIYVNYIAAISIFIILGGSYFLIYSLVRNNLHTRGISSTKATLMRYKTINESMHGIKHLKLRGSEAKFFQKFEEHDEEFYRNQAVSGVIALIPRFILETVTFGGIVLVLVILIISGETGQSIIPILSLYALAGYRLMPALQQIYVGLTQLKYNAPALDLLIDDFKELIDEPIKNSENKLKKIAFNESIELRSVCYKYHSSERDILHNLNLKISHNTTVGLVGPSGSGKTTLVDVLLGLLEKKSGSYCIDGIELNNDNLSNWQQNFGYVSQDIFLSDDSILNNIAFSVTYDEIDRAKVIQAAKLANIDDFIMSLPEGYNTFTGDRGVRLSGGQRQRIAIARALYFSPDILVLDEATSALDGSTENVIMDAINNLSHNKTIIIIAHRLETVVGCDIIHFVDNGRIESSGTYEELLKINKKFKNMTKKL